MPGLSEDPTSTLADGSLYSDSRGDGHSRVADNRSGSVKVLTRAHILDAIARSDDDGQTLVFSNRGLGDVGEAGADALSQVGKGEKEYLHECKILRCVNSWYSKWVVTDGGFSRIALVGNTLSSLPMAFARLSRLRYLTLRSNSFSVLPEVVSVTRSRNV